MQDLTAGVRLTAFGAVFFALVAVHPAMAQQQQCADLSTEMLETHRSLYEYALVAEYAYERNPPSHSCEAENIQDSASLELSWDEFRNPFGEHWSGFEAWNSVFSEGRNLDTNEYEWYIDENRIPYVVCRREGVTPFVPNLALTWVSRILAPGDEMQILDVFLDVVVVAPLAIASSWIEQGLGFLVLDRIDEQPEQMVAFRGTDLARLMGIPEVSTSLGDLLDRSCAFEIATRVVAEVGRRFGTSRLSVIGHSLGGAAAQYVARDQAANGSNYSSAAEFNAYSFNSVGLDVSNSDPSSLLRLYSYSIDGEIVSVLGEQLRRVQAGRAIRYIPPPGMEKWSGSVATELIRRHRITTVQEGLCDCLQGQGAISR